HSFSRKGAKMQSKGAKPGTFATLPPFRLCGKLISQIRNVSVQQCIPCNCGNRTKRYLMSNNDHLRLAPTKEKIDARVRRTRDALGDALITLMQEKPFDTITVQDVLDRAHVSRSTFYSHYSDKDDLLMSDADEFFQALSMALSQHG